MTSYDVASLRLLFPALQQQINGKSVCFLDSGASALKPQCVIDAMDHVYKHHYANIHRGLYVFAEETTAKYEKAREKVQMFLGASSPSEIVFVRNATEAINLVAYSYARHILQDGDHILISALEHHANIVPWHLLQKEKKITLDVVDILDNGELDYADFEKKLTAQTKLVAMTHVSNVLGVEIDIKRIVAAARKVGAKVLIDGSQGVVHHQVDVQDLDVDFYVFTGHKLYGPTGIGVLYAKYDILEMMPPFMGGGDMIDHVSFAGSTFAAPPSRFEAGTPAFVEAIGLGAAIDFVASVGMDAIRQHEQKVFRFLCDHLSQVPQVKFLVPSVGKAPIVSFVVEGAHAYDVASMLAEQGVCVRVGHHCAEPLMKRLGIDGSIRASLALYNDENDVHVFIQALARALKILTA